MTEPDIDRVLRNARPRPVKRGNPVGWVLLFAAAVAVLVTVLSLLP